MNILIIVVACGNGRKSQSTPNQKLNNGENNYKRRKLVINFIVSKGYVFSFIVILKFYYITIFYVLK